MNFKNYFTNSLMETIESNLGQSAAILRGSNKSEEAKEKAKEQVKKIAELLTLPYVDLPPGKGGNHVHLPILVKWIKEGADIQQLKNEYDAYMKLPETVKSNFNIKRMANFKQFFELLHQYVSKVQAETRKDISDNEWLEKIRHDVNVENAKRYEDPNIVVYEGTDEETSKKLSCYSHFGLCTGAEGDGNYFNDYRFNANQTTYYVYFKNEEAKNGHDAPFILVDVRESADSGKYLWNPVSKNKDSEISLRELVKMFPVLKKPIEEGVFKWTPINDKIWDAMAKNATTANKAFNFINALLSYNKFDGDKYRNVLDIVSKNINLCARTVEDLLYYKKLDPIKDDNLLRTIFTNNHHTGEIAEKMVKAKFPVPNYYLDDIATFETITPFDLSATYVAMDMPIPHQLPQLDQLLSKPHYKPSFFKILFRNNNLKFVTEHPEILKAVYEDYMSCSDLASILSKNTFDRAKYIAFLKTYPPLLVKILTMAITIDAFNVATDPQIISAIKEVATTPNIAAKLIFSLIGIQEGEAWKYLLNVIAKDPKEAEKIAGYYTNRGRKIPDIIQQSLQKAS